MMHSLCLDGLTEWRALEVALFYSVMLEFHLILSVNWSAGAVSPFDMTELVWSVIILKGVSLTHIYIRPLCFKVTSNYSYYLVSFINVPGHNSIRLYCVSMNVTPSFKLIDRSFSWLDPASKLAPHTELIWIYLLVEVGYLKETDREKRGLWIIAFSSLAYGTNWIPSVQSHRLSRYLLAKPRLASCLVCFGVCTK